MPSFVITKYGELSYVKYGIIFLALSITFLFVNILLFSLILFEKAKFISPFEKASIILSNVFNFSPASPSYELVALSKSLFSFLG